MKTKIISVLLTLMMLASYIPMSVSAEGDGTCGEGVTWSLADGVLTIGGSGAIADYDWENVPGWAGQKDTITKLVIGDGITSIGQWAFDSCTNLSEIDWGKGITSIGKRAFSFCDSLTSVVLPDNLKAIESSAFVRNENLQSIIMPKGLESIGSEAFVMCSSLTSVNIPDSVNTIGSRAFSECSSLESINIPKGITSIPEGMMIYSKGLKSVTIPENIKAIEAEAFSYCTGLEDITIPDNVTTLGERAFSGSGIKKITIPDSVTEMGSFLLSSCEKLTEVTLPENMTAVPEYMFYFCPALEVVDLPDSVETIGEWAFSNCYSLKEINIPGGVEKIPQNCFYACTGLETVKLPKSLKTIDSYAFYDCNALSKVSYGGEESDWAKVTIQGANNPLHNAKISYNHGDNGHGTYGDSISWVIDEEGVLKISGSGAIADSDVDSEDYSTAPWGRHESKVTAVVIDEGITAIGDYAFYGMTGMTSIDMPDTIERIGYRAFCDCKSLTKIQIPDSVTYIDKYAFYGCAGVKTVTLSENLTRVEYGAFNDVEYIFYRGSQEKWQTVAGNQPNVAILYDFDYGNVIEIGKLNTSVYWFVDDLGNLVIDGNGVISGIEPWKAYKDSITNVVIGDGITGVNSSILQQYNAVKTITIGKNVTTFGQQSDAFSWMQNLETVYWNAVSVEDMLFGGEYFTAFLRFSGTNNGGVNIVFGEGVTTVPKCFTRTNVKRMVIPSTVKKIDWNFSAKEIEVPDVDYWLGLEFGQYNRPLEYAKLYIDGELATDIVIPEGTTAIGNYAFYGAKDIKSVVIPDNVESIGDYAFYGCSGIERVELGAGIKDLGDYTFYGCSSLTAFEIPEGLTEIGENTFAGCASLTSVELPETVASIGAGAFAGTGITQLWLTKNVTKIGSGAFSNCTALTEVYYEGTVFDWDKVDGYKNLSGKKIYYQYENVITNHGKCGDNLNWTLAEDGTLTVMGTGDMYDYPSSQGTPWGKEGIKHLVIEDGVTSVGRGAFFDCYDLESAYIADSVTLIDYQAFCFCEKLTDLYIGKGVTQLGDSAFHWCTSLREVTIPGSVRIMDYNAFSYCDRLKTVVIEEGVPYIYNDAFNYCSSLEEVTIPLSVKSIGVAAFGYCTSLKKVNYAGTKADWNNIQFYDGNKSLITAYENGLIYETDGKCGENLEWKLENGVLTIWGRGDMYDYDITDAGLPWYDMGDEVTKIVIENGVTSIGAYTFWLCFGLKEVQIPATVTNIGNYAFGNCDKMTGVYYMSTKENWEKIEFNRLNPYIRDARIHFLDKELNLDFEDNKIYIVSDKKVEDAKVYAILFDENDNFLRADYVDVDIAEGIRAYDSPIGDYTGAVTVKVCAWGGDTAMEPVFEAGIIEK